MAHIEVERNGAVLHIAINRPEKKNALTAEMYDALADAVDQAESDPAIRVILLQGRGDAFTAGNDLEDFMKKPWKGQAVPPAFAFHSHRRYGQEAGRCRRARFSGRSRHDHPVAL